MHGAFSSTWVGEGKRVGKGNLGATATERSPAKNLPHCSREASRGKYTVCIIAMETLDPGRLSLDRSLVQLG